MTAPNSVSAVQSTRSGPARSFRCERSCQGRCNSSVRAGSRSGRSGPFLGWKALPVSTASLTKQSVAREDAVPGNLARACRQQRHRRGPPRWESKPSGHHGLRWCASAPGPEGRRQRSEPVTPQWPIPTLATTIASTIVASIHSPVGQTRTRRTQVSNSGFLSWAHTTSSRERVR